MLDVKTDASVATLVGDVVGSRGATDRGALHHGLATLLHAVNDEYLPLQPLRITIGDEYQGCFATLGEALAATLRIRLAMLPDVDIRHGVGWGPVAVLAEEPRVEDGPGWWAARDAIEGVKADAKKAVLRDVRTSYRRADDPAAAAGADPAPVNAALMCRDQMVGSLSERSVSLLGGLLAGRSQSDIAEEERISASAASQRVRNDGLGVIVAADALLRRMR
ncbi:MAG: SatD family protein [Actinomycetota bacterium]|nr:SatD family protein [Actinomycetota bacterium]